MQVCKDTGTCERLHIIEIENEFNKLFTALVMPVNVYYLCYVGLVPGCYEERDNGLLSTVCTCAKWPMIHGVSDFLHC